MPTFQADGLTLAYDDLGPPDGPVTVLVHGITSNKAEGWRRTGWYAALERRGARVLALDLRGHGDSDKPHDPAAYGRSAMAGDIVSMMDAAGVERADLIGYSMGARLALGTALAAPQRFDHLVLGGVGERVLTPSPPGDPLAEAMEADDPATIDQPLLRSFRQFADEQGEDRLALAAFARGGRFDYDAGDLARLHVPSLVVAGQRDALAGDPHVLAQHISGARALVLPGCDHFSAIPHALFKAGVFDWIDGWLEDDAPFIS